MRKINTSLACALLLGASLTLRAQEQATFKVTSQEQQTIDGFGASDAWSMWQIGTWEDSLQTKVADWLFSIDKGIGLSIWRFNAGAGSAILYL